jgi:hypothetical protein
VLKAKISKSSIQKYYNPADPYYNPADPYYNPADPYYNPADPYYNPADPHFNPANPSTFSPYEIFNYTHLSVNIQHPMYFYPHLVQGVLGTGNGHYFRTHIRQKARSRDIAKLSADISVFHFNTELTAFL